ncbi:MAG: hypothetical protein JWN75_1233 [Candidatus Saccharibacteria bacterium]|nr:hypothetical protein [Candidatus Saccharibacteria bacterium]
MGEEARHRHNFPALCRRPKEKPVKEVRTASIDGLKAFGARLIETGDLDPIYVALVGAQLDREQTKRWLLAYWMFYHAGFASYASEREGSVFWAVIERAAYNLTESPVGGRWPRGTERRHFRGDKCVNAVGWFANQATPEYFVDRLSMPSGMGGYEVLTHKAVIARATRWPQFGPWIAFKVADMLERCLGVPVAFSNEVALLYKEPAKCLDILYDVTATPTSDTYRDLEEWAMRMPAPPLLDRPCSHQEIETVLCKYKSHLGGHYEVGKDTKELREGLEGWGKTAKKLLAAAPVVV